MSIPEKLKPNVFQWESHRIQLFSEIAQFLKLTGFDNKFSLVLSVPINQIPKYPPLHWFTILFDIFWNGIPWGRLQRPYKGGRPEWAQDSRFVLMMAFADGTPDHEYNYHEFIVSYYQEFYKKQMRNNVKDFNSFLRMTESQLFGFEMDCGMNLEMGVVADNILPVLQLMGLMKFKFESIGNDDHPIRKITKIVITQIGKVFFAEYWKFIVKYSGKS
jgi:hypothetical protein